ncbi:hypothetical protein ORV05_02600 [Amycolatopsis cynarae]|uniref:Uncharacterized protein n=1 Tax=Amycolatopsis cynarae TaxID=2995223 RepID=A0ABY7B337_9PSEU|nr:hypothetical protein [Amycolatopsis sp. HUAS 11-8]WAL66724.1 hypothetical protein ORV05_02600 [Amycolatopsis sp. HUAS 11-8]
MTAQPLPLFPAHQTDPVRFAGTQHELFTGMNLRIGRSDTVHGVAWRPWINELTLPTPSCHQGWSGLGAAGELVATAAPVTCRKCRRILGLDPGRQQIPLFDLP